MTRWHQTILKTVKRSLGWILRPGLACRRLREARHAKSAPPVRADLDLSALPRVTVRRAETPEELAQVVELYKRNPSQLCIAPRAMPEMVAMLARNIEFFLYFNEEGQHIGNCGFQVDRRIFGYHQIDFAHRGGGYGMAATLAAEELLAQRGCDILFLQVYRDNRRALTSSLSIGYEIDEAESTERYFTLKKVLKKPGPSE